MIRGAINAQASAGGALILGVLPNLWQLLGAGGVILGVVFASGLVFSRAEPVVMKDSKGLKETAA